MGPMEERIQKLITQYQRHLSQAESNLRRFELLNQKKTEQYKTQKILETIWKMVLKDLSNLSDKAYDDHSKKNY